MYRLRAPKTLVLRLTVKELGILEQLWATLHSKSYVKLKVENWVLAVKKLAVIATTQPHAAFAAFSHCLQGQWTFLSRAMPGTSDLFQPLE